jgi:peptidoglycan/xylan/chitin deacetylase (PgdA/CDA1 family)
VLKQILGRLSPSGQRARLSVLIFHRVLARPDPLFPDEMDAARFDQLCGWLKSWFNVLPLDQAVASLQNGSLPARAACITFDDGYADNHQVALPILRRHGLAATFFIATGFLDGGRMWNDTIIETVRAFSEPVLDLQALGLGHHAVNSIDEKRAAIAAIIDSIKYRSVAERVAITEQLAGLAKVRPPQDLMMSSQAVREMRRAGMQIGAHTVSHPILARLTTEQARDEIGQSKQFLEQLLGERVGLFAYPNGKPGVDYNTDSVTIARELGFDAAVSTHWGAVRSATDVFQMPRFTPWDRTRLRFGVRMARNLLRS